MDGPGGARRAGGDPTASGGPAFSAPRLAAGFALCSGVVLVPAWVVPPRVGPAGMQLERELVRWFHGWEGSHPLVDRVFTEAMSLGAGWVMACLSLLMAVLLWRTDRTRALLPVVAYVGTLGLHYLGKIVVGRPRPPFIDANPAFASGSAYPSGHALEAAAVWGTVLYVVSRYAPAAARPAVWIALGLMVLLQGVNRLYFGLHWASDVVVGWVAGSIWALTCIAAARGEPRPPGLLREHPDRETS